ncbi:MAG: hypothetical protein ABIG61_12550 [Planctomycetota bacterium]
MKKSIKIAGVICLICSSIACCEVMFRDGFESAELDSRPATDKWAVLAAGESKVVVASDIITTDGTKMVKLVSSNPDDRAVVYTRTKGPYKYFKVEANIILDYDTSPHGTCVDLRTQAGDIAASLRLVPAKGTGKYDAKVLCRDGAGASSFETVKSELTVGQWQKWAFSINVIENHTGKGTFDVYCNDRPVVRDKLYYPFSARTASVDLVEFWTAGGQSRVDAVVIDADSKKQTKQALTPSLDRYEPGDFNTVDFTLSVEPKGHMDIAVGQQVFSIRSKFSTPGGNWLEFAPTSPTEYDLKIYDVNSSKVIKAVIPFYSVTRTIRVYSNHIAVNDEITNLTDKLLGVRLANEVTASGDSFGSKVCGNLIPPVEKSLPERPFVHLVSKNALVGLIARDDVYRNQAVCYGTQSKVGIRTDHFGLAPWASYTLRWEIYPHDSADYYDFINTVRQVWGTADRTIPYACGFFDYRVVYKGKRACELSDEELRRWMELCGVGAWTFVVTAGPGEPKRPNGGEVEAFGYDYLYRQDVRNRMKAVGQAQIARRIKRLCPDIRVGAYTHYTLNALDDPNVAAYRDARVMKTEREQLLWAVRYKDDHGNWLYGFYYPTFRNEFGKMITKMYNRMIEDFGDHVYIDEYGFVLTVEPMYMHDVPDWDGHSVLIDPETGNVVKKLSNLSLVTRDFRGMLADLGEGIAFANLQPATEADTARDVTYFLEYLSVQDYPRGHLTSPVTYACALGNTRRFMGFIYDSLQYGLLVGIDGTVMIHTEHPSPLKYFYPITIREIRPGYVVGKNKIITSLPGRYGFADSSEMSLIVYSVEGVPRRPAAEQLKLGNKNFIQVNIEQGEIAIINRR